MKAWIAIFRMGGELSKPKTFLHLSATTMILLVTYSVDSATDGQRGLFVFPRELSLVVVVQNSQFL